MRIGIDATNVGGGGGITHLKEILTNYDEVFFSKSISRIVVFASQKVFNELPELDVLEKVTFDDLNGSILSRSLFQFFRFDKFILNQCDILFSITGDYLGNFKPVVGMSRNMLLYDRGSWKEMNSFKEKSRFYLNFLKQKRCFSHSDGIIFISSHAKIEVNRILPISNKIQRIIHHGISPKFLGSVENHHRISEFSAENPFKFLYVSTVHTYKHHGNVVEAVANLRNSGFPVELHLVGGVIFNPAGDRLNKSIQAFDPDSEFIHYHGHQPYDNIQLLYHRANGVIFASSCENMPNILLESMASGLPIACSNYQPMPEFLENGGFYFDPKSVDSIVSSLKELLNSPKRGYEMARDNLERIKKYSWEKTSKSTFQFIIDVANNHYAQK